MIFMEMELLNSPHVPVPLSRIKNALRGVGFLVLLASVCVAQGAEAGKGISRALNRLNLPMLEARASSDAGDWLVSGTEARAALYRDAASKEVVLDNGLIRRVFRVEPEGATVAFENLMLGTTVIRAIKPEAVVWIDGVRHEIGGLSGQPDQAYLLAEWVDAMERAPGAFRCVGIEKRSVEAPMDWKRTRHAATVAWPPPGVGLRFVYESTEPGLAGVTLSVHYELYDSAPVLCKWVTIENRSAREHVVDSIWSEVLAPVDVESVVDDREGKPWRLPAIEFLSDYSFHGMDESTADQVTQWLPDPSYTSQVNYLLKMPALMVSGPGMGPGQTVPAGGRFDSHRTYVVIHDSGDRERQGLVMRRAQRMIAPWITENPLMMHVRSSETPAFRLAVDQCAEVGFEMIIYTFGSGLDMENEAPEYIARIKADVEYAHSKGIEVGAYSLLASRRVSEEHDVIHPVTGKTGGAIFGNSPCLESSWGRDYFRKIRSFMEQTGLDLLEHDGSYPGDPCASERHPGHRGLADSQWNQWKTISEFYRWCRSRGTYLNVPDYYFLAGSNKTGMGYRETNWSLPRERQIILGRQNIYDGCWTKAPSMGWMFVPLVEYHGGGAAATLEPLSEHLDGYEAHLINNLGAGVQACYRGPRLYDTDATKAVVKKWVAWFKEYRDILESDLIHLRRPDGRDIDCFLHVNPDLENRAMAVVYNPLDTEVERTLTLPLYYSGLSSAASVREKSGEWRRYALDREYRIRVPVRIPARGVTWLVLRKP